MLSGVARRRRVLVRAVYTFSEVSVEDLVGILMVLTR